MQTRPADKFPDDENGELLRLMQEQGDDLSRSRRIDFYFLFDARDDATACATEARQLGEFAAEVLRWERAGKWQLRLSRHMVPGHAPLTALERQLSSLARKFRGEADGWGCPPAD